MRLRLGCDEDCTCDMEVEDTNTYRHRSNIRAWQVLLLVRSIICRALSTLIIAQSRIIRS